MVDQRNSKSLPLSCIPEVGQVSQINEELGEKEKRESDLDVIKKSLQLNI